MKLVKKMRKNENKRENMRIILIMWQYGMGFAVANLSIKAYYRANGLALNKEEC